MPDAAPQRIGTRRAYQGRLLEIDVDTLEAPDGRQFDLEIIRHPGAAAVVPLLSDPGADDPRVLLLRQYRHAAADRLWEIPAGVLEEGEDPLACARRELAEETGASARSIDHLTTF